MLNSFLKFISEKKLFSAKQKLIVAVSGGVDSIVLAHLCHQAGFKFGIAHCNFGLRDEESDRDEKFVKQFAKKLNVPFYARKFKTQIFSDPHHVSVQMAARQTRAHSLA